MNTIEASKGTPMPTRILMAVGLLVALQPVAHAGAFAFDPPTHVGSHGAYAVEVADFNGDGRDDLAALVEGHLEVALQDGTGALAAPLRLEINSAYFHDIQVADLGADGTIQLLVGHERGLAVYTWYGVGGYGVATYWAQVPCRFLATADLDFDGAADVYCHAQGFQGALYYSGPGNALQAPVYMQAPVNMGFSYIGEARLGDVTGDGKPDLVQTANGYNSFFVHAHDGARGFLPPVAYPYPEEDDSWSGAIEIMDVDGDGSNEVIVAKPCNRPCSEILVFSRGEHGYLALSQRFPSHDIPRALLASDIDRDGRQDLLVGHAGWHSVGRYMGQDAGLSGAEVLTSVPTHAGSNRYALGDLDHDGFTDLAVANSFGVSVLYGGHSAPSDFDGDRVSDVLWRHSTGRNVIWRSADSTQPTTLDDLDAAWSIQATGDFDGDGAGDVFWRNHETGANEIRLSAHDPQSTTGVTSQHWQVVGAGDFDGDGRSDLLWRNARTGANTIWKAGNSAMVQATSGVTDLRWKVVGVGDFDGDDRSDILWRHATSGANVIWRGGHRASPRAVVDVTNLAWKVAGVGDFDGDGEDDMVWRNGSTGMNAIWLSANKATSQAVRGVSNLAWTIAAVGDYNGDGRSDLLWRNTASGANVIWRSADARQQQAVATVRGLAWEIVP